MEIVRVLLHNVGWRCGFKMDNRWELHPFTNIGWDTLGWRCSVCGAIGDEERGHVPPPRD
jgi:hypothetical protein